MSQVNQAVGLLGRIRSGEIAWTATAGILAAGLPGVFLVLGTGIVGAEVLHNAAHDVRHGLSFPCH